MWSSLSFFYLLSLSHHSQNSNYFSYVLKENSVVLFLCYFHKRWRLTFSQGFLLTPKPCPKTNFYYPSYELSLSDVLLRQPKLCFLLLSIWSVTPPCFFRKIFFLLLKFSHGSGSYRNSFPISYSLTPRKRKSWRLVFHRFVPSFLHLYYITL